MKTIHEWFDAYGESHKNPTNKAFHWLCVPVIFVCVVGLFSLIPHEFFTNQLSEGLKPYLHFGTIALAIALLFYLRLSWVMFLAMGFIAALSLYIVKLINLNYPENNWIIYLSSFALAWVGQFIGHKIEGKKPSFLDDLQFLMIGPAWLMGFIFRKLNIKY